jgi:HK97 family phage major capsid protein
MKALGGYEPGETISESDAKALNDVSLGGATVGTDGSAKSLGDAFVEHPAFKELLERTPNLATSRDVRVQIDPMHVKGVKALLGPTQLPGMVGVDSRGPQGPYVWGRTLMLRNVITVGSTTSDVVEFARQLAQTNNAAPVPTTATDADDATPTTAEGFKPQSIFTFEKVTQNVKTIAHWLAATKRSLSDVGQLRTLIDSFLRFGLEEELEDQVISGDGTGENFPGIMTTSGVQAQAFSTNVIETIRKAITKVGTVGRARPTAVALHPTDDEGLDLAKDSQNRYYGNGPFGTGPSTIWGLPRVVTEAVPVGNAIVADWRFAALWDREDAIITATDSHKDFFVRNLIAVLAELRAAFGIIRPAAFVIADLTA